jgi:hypothetical protein
MERQPITSTDSLGRPTIRKANTMDKHPKLAKLEAMIAEQDAEHERKLAEHEAKVAKITGVCSVADYIEGTTMGETKLDETDGDRRELLDRIAKRMPELNLDQYEVGWHKLPDGHEALVLDGGGMDGGNGMYLANAGDDVTVIGPTAPLAAGGLACVVVDAKGGRRLGGLVRDPLLQDHETTIRPTTSRTRVRGRPGHLLPPARGRAGFLDLSSGHRAQ